LIEGELTLIVDKGEAILKPGMSLFSVVTNHAVGEIAQEKCAVFIHPNSVGQYARSLANALTKIRSHQKMKFAPYRMATLMVVIVVFVSKDF